MGAVRCAKHHLKRVIGNSTFTYEESTLLTMIEACVNSKPLCTLTEDPSDLQALTRAHFLLSRPLLPIPELCTLFVSSDHLPRWRTLNQMQDDLWKVWKSEYLYLLQTRSKWPETYSNIVKVALVLIKNMNLRHLLNGLWLELSRYAQVKTSLYELSIFEHHHQRSKDP